jgi:uncharacterized protein (DUF1697 family)
MNAYIALLRAVNLGPHNKVSMTALRQFAVELDLREPRTLLQSGNLVFRSRKSAAALESMLETEARKRLGLETGFFVRDVDTWDAIIAANPFPEAAAREPSRFVVAPLRSAPEDDAVDALKDAVNGRELVEVVGREAYIVYPDGIGRSKLTIGVIESKLGTRGTARNWNTVLKLAALARE